jgi:dTDP-4-amino-4,6-dideoxygalactose transaminase
MAKISIPWWQVQFDASAAEAARNQIIQGNLTMGETTELFENSITKILGVKYCVATGSGTSALLMALVAAGVDIGDRVAIQDRIWIAPANAAHILGAKIVLVDVDKYEPRINLEHLSSVLKSKPKVLVLVHMNGRSNYLSEIADMCRTNGTFLIEDAAQAIGSNINGKLLGTFSDIGCFSLAISKTISSGQGGFCVTNNEKLYQKLRKLRIHGQVNLAKPSWSGFGLNLRYSDFQAALALNQINFLDSRINYQTKCRNKLIELTSNLNFLRILAMRQEIGESGPYIDSRVEDVENLKNFLYEFGIETKRFYPSVSTAHYLRIENRNEIINAHEWFNHGLILPSGPALKESQLDQLVEKLNDFDAK